MAVSVLWLVGRPIAKMESYVPDLSMLSGL